MNISQVAEEVLVKMQQPLTIAKRQLFNLKVILLLGGELTPTQLNALSLATKSLIGLPTNTSPTQVVMDNRNLTFKQAQPSKVRRIKTIDPDQGSTNQTLKITTSPISSMTK